MPTQSSPAPTPTLAPPGAGLPTPELLIARALFALRRWRGNRASFSTQFAQERTHITQLLQPQDPKTLATRALIPRLRGLEDSSRHWSVYMTLDHLRIVNTQIASVIDELTQDRVPQRQASTATVKPSPDVDASILQTYEHACEHLITLVASKDNLNTRATYAHPWFGPLSALGWHALAATHMRIHRAQIATILSTLNNPPS